MFKKALDFINKEIEGCIMNIEFCRHKGYDSPFHDQRLIDLNNLKEAFEKLLDQTKTPTIEEVKKEEQKIFKELKNIGWEVTFRNLNGIDFQNIIGQKILIYLTDKSYYSKVTLSSKTHQLLHKLFELWGWFDE